eukprot:6691052-Pyramimonas_sp.AAC.1
MPAVPWTTVMDSGRGERPPPLRTPSGVENMPCLLCCGRPSRIAARVRDHPLCAPPMVSRI